MLIFLNVSLAFLKLRQLFTEGQNGPCTKGSGQLLRVFVSMADAAKDVAVSRVGCDVRHESRHPRVAYWMCVGPLSNSQ